MGYGEAKPSIYPYLEAATFGATEDPSLKLVKSTQPNLISVFES